MPAIAAVVLQANVALLRMVFLGRVELVLQAVVAPVPFGPFVEVHASDFLAVELYGAQRPLQSVRSSQRPPFAVFELYEGVQFRRVLDLEIFAVPFDPRPRRPQGQHAQEHDFGQRSGVVEV